LALPQAVGAQDHDDRWYLTWGLGYNQQDTDRRTSNSLAVSASLGRYLNPK